MRVSLMPSLHLRMVPRTPVPEANDATKVAPSHYYVVFENSYVRLVGFQASPGDMMLLHTHPPHLSFNLTPARMKITYRKKGAEVQDLHPGQAAWSDGVEHAGEVLQGKVDMLLIEVKGVASRVSQFRPATGMRP